MARVRQAKKRMIQTRLARPKARNSLDLQYSPTSVSAFSRTRNVSRRIQQTGRRSRPVKIFVIFEPAISLKKATLPEGAAVKADKPWRGAGRRLLLRLFFDLLRVTAGCWGRD